MRANSDRLKILQEQFLETAFVKDAQQGYLVAKDFNLAIDPNILELASECWAAHYQEHAVIIDAVVGLPDAGSRLVSILGQLLKVQRILPSKRADAIPGAWEDVISYSNQSFTTNQEEVRSHIGFIWPGQRVLLVDDVVAHGHTAIAAIKALQSADVIVVGLAVLFDKAWQGGQAKIKRETGVDVFSLIHVQEIKGNGKIAV